MASASVAVLEVARLGAGPWPTDDPFLFAVYHDDNFPPGNEELGVDKKLLRGRRLGSDFGNEEWNMYHGESVPGFPKHPHRGFETVSVVRHGLIDHVDSLGAAGRFGGGDVQWMTAGAGISHSEMFPLLDSESKNRVELFQIWLNLPKKDKMAAPNFLMLWREQLPRVHFEDASGRATDVTVIAGGLDGRAAPAPPPASWAADESNGLAIWTLRMDPGASWELPAGPGHASRSLYVFAGGVSVAGRSVPANSKVRLRPGAAVELQAGGAEAEMIMLQGRPIGERVVQHGPFVMTSQDEIRQAFVDYQRTGFGGWPWPSECVAHPRAEGRFALYPDGRKDIPVGAAVPGIASV